MTQLIQYVMSTGAIFGIYEASTAALLTAQIVAGDPTYGYLMPSQDIALDQQEQYEIVGGVVQVKTELMILATPPTFMADGMAECTVTVSPFVDCSLVVGSTIIALTGGDPTLTVTSEVPAQFLLRLIAMPGYWAPPRAISASDTPTWVPALTSGLTLGETTTVSPGRLTWTPQRVEGILLSEVVVGILSLREANNELVTVAESVLVEVSLPAFPLNIIESVLVAENQELQESALLLQGLSDTMVVGEALTLQWGTTSLLFTELLSLGEEITFDVHGPTITLSFGDVLMIREALALFESPITLFVSTNEIVALGEPIVLG